MPLAEVQRTHSHGAHLPRSAARNAYVSRGSDRVVSHDTRTCAEASTWRVQFPSSQLGSPRGQDYRAVVRMVGTWSTCFPSIVSGKLWFWMRHSVAALVLFLVSAFGTRLCATALVAFLFAESWESYWERRFAGHALLRFAFGRFSVVFFGERALGDLLSPNRAAHSPPSREGWLLQCHSNDSG